MRENSASTTPHPSLQFACPFCKAAAGHPCRAHRGRGRELDGPHIRRIRVTQPPTPTKQAICCDCGQVRTYKDAWRARTAYARWQRYTDGGRFDRWRSRMVGDLKCNHCGKTTTHALLADPSVFRDSDEREQLLALGDQPRHLWERQLDLDRLRREYRQAMPRNPHLIHRYRPAEARAAQRAGVNRITAVCGEPIPIETDPHTGEAVYYDVGEPEPCSKWEKIECVDCLRVSNEYRRAYERQRLQRHALKLYALLRDSSFQVGDGDMTALLENIRKLLP